MRSFAGRGALTYGVAAKAPLSTAAMKGLRTPSASTLAGPSGQEPSGPHWQLLTADDNQWRPLMAFGDHWGLGIGEAARGGEALVAAQGEDQVVEVRGDQLPVPFRHFGHRTTLNSKHPRIKRHLMQGPKKWNKNLFWKQKISINIWKIPTFYFLLFYLKTKTEFCSKHCIWSKLFCNYGIIWVKFPLVGWMMGSWIFYNKIFSVENYEGAPLGTHKPIA